MFIYVDNEQMKKEIKKAIIDNDMNQKKIAEVMGCKPQQFTNIINKENFAFRDMKKICDAMDCDLIIDFVKRDKK